LFQDGNFIPEVVFIIAASGVKEKGNNFQKFVALYLEGGDTSEISRHINKQREES